MGQRLVERPRVIIAYLLVAIALLAVGGVLGYVIRGDSGSTSPPNHSSAGSGAATPLFPKGATPQPRPQPNGGGNGAQGAG